MNAPTERMQILKTLTEERNSKPCPKCGALNNCAMDAGHSINNCWCISYPLIEFDFNSTTCLCRTCLTMVDTI